MAAINNITNIKENAMNAKDFARQDAIRFLTTDPDGPQLKPGDTIHVTGDHRPINHFLADWDAAGRPPVDVADDHETLLLA